MPRKQKAGVLIIGALVVAGCTTSQHRPTTKNTTRWAPDSKDVLVRAKKAKRHKVLPATHFAAARLFEGRGLYDKAIIQYRKAVAVNHSYAAAHHRLGLLLSMVGKRDEAFIHFTRAVKLEPSDAVFQNNLGFEHLLAKRWEESIKHFELAINITPRFARAHVNLGMALSRVGRFEEAFASFTAVLPEADAHYNMGLMLRGQGRHSQAMDEFVTVLAINPNFQAAKTQLAELKSERMTHLGNGQQPAATLTGSDARVIQNVAPARPVTVKPTQTFKKPAPATVPNTKTMTAPKRAPNRKVKSQNRPKPPTAPREDPRTQVDTPNTAIRLADTQDMLEAERNRSAQRVETVDAVAQIDAPFLDEFALDEQTTSPVDENSKPPSVPPSVSPAETFRIIPILTADFDGIVEDFIDEWNVEEADCEQVNAVAKAVAEADLEFVFDKTQAASITEVIKTLREKAARAAKAVVDYSEAELVSYAPVDTTEQTPLLVDLAEPAILEQTAVVDLGISAVASVPDEIWFGTEEIVEQPCEEYLALDQIKVLDNAGFESQAGEPVIDLNADPDLLTLTRILGVAEFDPLLDTMEPLDTPNSPRLTDSTPRDTAMSYDDWATLFVDGPASDVDVQAPVSVVDRATPADLATPVEDVVATETVATIDPQAMLREFAAELAAVREEIACLDEIDTRRRPAFALPTPREISDTDSIVLSVGPGPLYPTRIAGPMGPPFDAAPAGTVATRTRFTALREAENTPPRRARLMSRTEEVVEDQPDTARSKDESASTGAQPLSWIGPHQQIEPLFAFADEQNMTWEQLVQQTEPEPPLDNWLLELFDLDPQSESNDDSKPVADLVDSRHEPFGDIVPVKNPATPRSDPTSRQSRRRARSGPE